jgi:hypothetical protein
MTATLVWAQGLSPANYFYFLVPIFLLSTALNMLGRDWIRIYGKMRMLSLQFDKKNGYIKWIQRVGVIGIFAGNFKFI